MSFSGIHGGTMLPPKYMTDPQGALADAQAEMERLWAEAEKSPDNSDLDPDEFSGQFLRPSKDAWPGGPARLEVYESGDPEMVEAGKRIARQYVADLAAGINRDRYRRWVDACRRAWSAKHER